MIYAKLLNGTAVFEELAADWDTVAAQATTNSPFQTIAYQKAWWQHLQPENSTLHSVAVYDDETLVGIACFYLLDGMLYFNGSMEETDYLDVITAEETAAAVWTAVFDCLCSPAFPAWTGLDLYNIPAASPSRPLLTAAAQQRGFLLTEEVAEVCPTIPLPATFDAYLDSIDSKQRREIQRKLRRADGAEANFVVVGAEDDIDQAVSTFLELLQQSTFEKRDWLNEGRRALFYDTARAAQQAGTLQLAFIEVNGRTAAALFNFDYNGRIWVYNSGLDPSAFGNLSLGVVITAKAIEHAIENSRREFDFLRGNETYKYRFGAQDTTIYRYQITPKGE